MPDLRALIESGLIDKEDGTIFDTNTNLLWQQSPSERIYTWKEVSKYCKSLTLAGHNDWRLPTVDELKVLINMKYQPVIDPILKCEPERYWSSSIDSTCSNYAWLIDFSDGYIHCGNMGNRYLVRTVRPIKE